jgi:hypothetical protein
MNYEQLNEDFQNTLAVLAEVERRQSQINRLRAEVLSKQKPPVAEPSEARRRIDRNLAEITVKLNRLVAKKDSLRPASRH